MSSLQEPLSTLLGARWAFIGLGILLAIGGVSGAIYAAVRDDDRPILRYPTAIAISGEGDIYVYSDRSTMRVFSPSGAQLHSWLIESARGKATISLEPSGTVAVATARNHRLLKFTSTGRLISSKLDPGAFERIGHLDRHVAKGPDGMSYEIVDMAIVRKDREGGREVVIAGVPAALRPFFIARLPPLLFAVQGIALIALGVALVVKKNEIQELADRGIPWR